MKKKLNWGIIGTGKIAAKFAAGLLKSKTGKLAATGSRELSKAKDFALKFSGKAYGSYEELLADSTVEAVYISTPHPLHFEWVVKAAGAKKHILCEKPIGINYLETQKMVRAARVNKVFLMEAFMYRCHPQTKKLVELLKKKTIGEVRNIQCAFSYNAGFDPKSRIFKNSLAGGGILDVGCYCISMARLVAGIANKKDFIEPLEVKAFGRLTKTGVDGFSVGILKFPGDVFAEVATGVQLAQQNVVRIYGSKGSIELPSPWHCSGKILLTRAGKTKEIILKKAGDIYAIEADAVAEAVLKKKLSSPAMTPKDTLGNMKACDMWRAGFKFKYNSEKRR